ncbi:hypothetical protein SDC9_188026 [bioreactor metagenome]|uniref:Uncharacterized protein n=1 Tax=bioreactor metagenome TaxID=1076179 RepID=A0A645HN72_9ZZZZ
MIAHRMRRIHAVQTQAFAPLAHMVGSALARGLHQCAQHRHDQLVQREALFVNRMQPGHGRAHRIAPVILALNPAAMLQRSQQSQHRALVKARALGQLGQAQRGIAILECAQHAEGAVHGCHTARRGILVGYGFIQGFTRHEKLLPRILTGHQDARQYFNRKN